jgi:hypothetical protein
VLSRREMAVYLKVQTIGAPETSLEAGADDFWPAPVEPGSNIARGPVTARDAVRGSASAAASTVSGAAGTSTPSADLAAASEIAARGTKNPPVPLRPLTPAVIGLGDLKLEATAGLEAGAAVIGSKKSNVSLQIGTRFLLRAAVPPL